jgi:predicted ATPase
MELAVEAARVGITTLVGHCYDREDPVPFAPFVEILEDAMERASSRAGFRALLGTDAAEISRLMPQLSRLFSDIPAAMELAPAQSQWILFKAVGELLGRMASGNPLLLLIEDLHWSDQGTLALLEHLARNIHKIPALIVGNYRDDELDSKGSLAKTLGELTRLRLAEQVSLSGLTESAVAEMVQSLSGSEPSPALVRLLHKTTDGNPFFVGELIRHLAERGQLADFNRKVSPELTPDQLDLPDSLRLVIGRRVNRVGDETRSVLAAAAVIGRSFPFALLEAVTHADPDLLLDHVEEAERAGLISSEVVQQEAQFKFAHELIRRTVLDELSAVRRQRLHLSVAEAIEAIYPDTADDHARDLAHHFWNAGAAADVAKTIHYSRLAGDQAAQSYSNVEAEQHYAHALAAALRLPLEPGALIDMYVKRGVVLNILGRHDDAIADYQRACEIARSTRDRQREVQVLFRLSGVYWDSHQKDPTLEYSRQALKLAREIGDKFLEAMCILWTLSAGNSFGPNSLAREQAEQALNLAETTGSPLLCAFAHQNVGGGAPVAG